MSEKTSPPPPYYPSVPQPAGYATDPNYNPQYAQQGGYAQQETYGYPPQQVPPPQGQATVIVQTHSAVLGSGPSSCYCPKCQETVVTRCEYDNSSMAWIICLVLFFTGFCFLIPWFICWIPFCIDSMKNVIHRCPKCASHLGTVNRGGF